jgi:Flp pilus assembly protein TadG
MRAMRRSRRNGQSLTELALVTPVLVLLILAAGQFGVILFGAVTLDTATRDGARAAAQQPVRSGAFANGSAGVTQSSGTIASNCNPVVGASSAQQANHDGTAICQAVCEASGGKPGFAPTASCAGGLTMNVTAITPVCQASGSITTSGCPAPSYAACPGAVTGVRDGYISVTATYQAPIFIPLLGGMLADSTDSSHRTMTDTVTTRVEPCAVTQGR